MKPSTPRSEGRVVIIGAGIAGLATAVLLAEEGSSVTIVEKNSTVGGRAGSLEDPATPGFRWDTGPSWYLMPEAYDNFYALAGTSTEDQLELVNLEPGYRVFPEGAAHFDVSSDPATLAELFENIEPGAGKKLEAYLAKAGEIYAVSVENFLYTTFSNLRPFLGLGSIGAGIDLLKNLLASLSQHVSSQFTDVRLRQILTYPAVFLSSRPEDTPALYQLMSYTDLVQGVKYPLGGFTAVVESLHKLAKQRGVEILFETSCVAIHTQDGAGRTQATGIHVESNGQREMIPADVVVSTADMHLTETELLPRELQSYPEKWWTHRNPGISTVLVMIGVKGELPQLSHHNLMFSHDWTPDFDAVFEPSVRSTNPGNASTGHANTGHAGTGHASTTNINRSASIYISKPSESDPTVAPEGHSNLFVLVPVAADPALGHGNIYAETASDPVQAIADAAITQIAEWAGIDDLHQRIIACHTIGPADFEDRYHSWLGGALGPAHTLWQSAFLRGKNRSTKVNNLLYAGGTTVPGVGVPMCLISAENVLKRMRGDGSTSALGTQ